MQNLEIIKITNLYELQKNQNLKAKEDGKEVREPRLPAAIAWKKRLNIDKLLGARKIIDEAIKEIQEKYSDDERSTAGKNDSRQVKPEYMEAFTKEQMDILDQDTDVTIKKVKISELEGLELTDSDMDTLMFMIEEAE